MKRLLLTLALLALLGGQAWALSGTVYVDSLTSWDAIRVRLTTSGEAPDSLVKCELWGSTVHNSIGNARLWGTVTAPWQSVTGTHLDTLTFTGMPAFTLCYFRWKMFYYDTTLATGSRTTLLSAFTAVDSGYTKHHAMPRVVAADTAGCDSTINAIKVLLRLPIVATDSAATRWQLYYATDTTATWTWADSATAINKTSDTSSFVTGLYNGTTYYFYASVTYKDTSAANIRYHTYTTPITSGYTKTIGQTIVEISDSTSYRNFQIKDTWFSDTALVTLGMQYRVHGATSWTWATPRAVWADRAVGRDSVGLGSPDTLWALTGGISSTGYVASLTGGTIDLLAGTVYDVRVVGYCGTAAAQAFTHSDTSNTIEITTGTLPAYKATYDSSAVPGYWGPNIYHFKTTWNKLNYTWTSPKIDLTPYSRIRVSGSMFGRDNNHPGDSTKVWMRTLRSSTPQGWVCVDSSFLQITNRPIADTLSFFKKYAITPSGRETTADSAVVDSIGGMIWFYLGVQDSNLAAYGASTDTTTLDPHYFDIWITGWEK
jgi:hypothetical protein